MYVCVGAPPSTCNAYLLLLLMELPNKLPYSPLSCNGGHASGGYNILKFNNIFVPIEAKTQSQLSGLCVVCSKTHRDMHNDVKFSARCCSNVPNTHRSNSGLGVLCNNTLEHWQRCACFYVCVHTMPNTPCLLCGLLDLKNTCCWISHRCASFRVFMITQTRTTHQVCFVCCYIWWNHGAEFQIMLTPFGWPPLQLLMGTRSVTLSVHPSPEVTDNNVAQFCFGAFNPKCRRP
jgi:hypothetical protein